MLMLQLGETYGVVEDIQALAQKSPQAISQVIKIVNKGGAYLPQIVEIVDRVGTQLPKVLKIIKKVEPHLDLVVNVVEDPAFPEVIQRIKTIRALRKAEKAAASSKPLGAEPSTAEPEQSTGVGLKRALKPLDMYIYVRKHRWVPYAVGAGIILLLVGTGFGVGYGVAKRKARKAA